MKACPPPMGRHVACETYYGKLIGNRDVVFSVRCGGAKSPETCKAYKRPRRIGLFSHTWFKPNPVLKFLILARRMFILCMGNGP